MVNTNAVNTIGVSECLTLCAGPLRLVLAPAIGGSIARFDHVAGEGRIPILRGVEGVPANPLAAASFPLVPFSNRIRGGRFVFRGREIVLAPNMLPDPSPLHGQGWLAPWSVKSSGDGHAALRFRHEPGEWPWCYEARQTFRLDRGGLDIRLECRNLSDEPMPCGLGLHPYFPCASETRIDTRAEVAWTIDAQVLPVDRVPATGRYGLADRAVCGQDLDNGFGGWSGRARIDTPELPFVIAMTSDTAGFFQLYSPLAGGVFVAEPVTHANAALNEPEAEWPALGLRVLEPGEAMAMAARIAVIPRGRA